MENNEIQKVEEVKIEEVKLNEIQKVEEEEKEIVVTDKTGGVRKDTESPLISYVNSLDDKIVYRANCKFCQAKDRFEAEELYEQKHNITEVKKFLTSKGTNILYNQIRNHLAVHYRKFEKTLKMKEYVHNLKKWKTEINSKRGTLEERKAILNNEMLTIASETEGLDLEERRKSAETINKLSGEISHLEEKIDEIDKGLEPVYIIIEKFKDIIASRIKKTDNERIKNEFMSLLEELAVSLKDLEIEV